MRLCVYGAASDAIDNKYISAVEFLGKTMAKRGHSLVYGGGGVGVMGAVARGVHENGGYVLGVIPRFFQERSIELLYENNDQTIYTYTLQERKEIMEDNADGFIVAPGGIGTYDEFFEALTLKQLGRHNKPIVLYNVDGFYDPLIQMLLHADSEKFLREGLNEKYAVFSDAEKMIDYFEKYKIQ